MADAHAQYAMRANPTFYMYENPALDHSWMKWCPGFVEWTTGVRMQNTAEVGAHAALSRCTNAQRVWDPDQADLFFVPIFPYLSQKIDRCEGRHGNRTHAGRMQHAAEQLDKSPHWRRRQGRDHFYVTTTWSTSRFSFYTGMQQLGRKLACGISGRYKPFPIAGSLKSALTSCTFHAPYEANPYAMREYRRNLSRTMLITFAGAFDVCCTGKAIRCKLGDLMVAALGQADVSIRPTLGANVSADKLGECTGRAAKLVAQATTSRAASGQQTEGRRLSTSLRESVVTTGAIQKDARALASSVFCLTPAGDNCVSGRFYSALAAGCIPVVICPSVGQHPVPFHRSKVVKFEPFWIDFPWSTFSRRPAALLEHLRSMSPETVARYQRGVAAHRLDLLYHVHGSRVGANLLREVRQGCFSDRAIVKMAHKHVCGANASWPYRANMSAGQQPSGGANANGTDDEAGEGSEQS
eukprot:Transcript_20827.p1 GENE.Transcript_20827~~Transcript_20827.p1  ORF type:complete len:467 (+),score=77.20 Transcript_20827:129-1529(+)